MGGCSRLKQPEMVTIPLVSTTRRDEESPPKILLNEFNHVTEQDIPQT